jgi:hypothetical protein
MENARVKRILFAALVAAVAIAPMQARAGEVGAVVAGGVVGGLAGSVYTSGMAATATSVGSAVAGAASTVPAAATGVATAVTAASAPVLFGVAVGGAAAFLIYTMAH